MAAAEGAYKLSPLGSCGWGASVTGIDLKQPVPQSTVNQIKNYLHKHRLLVFRDQGVIPGSRQVEISRWFGEPESTFFKHPASPHPDIFAVSNDESKGCTNVGRTGWHIDGSFMAKPFKVATYHIVAVPTAGATVFLPLREMFESAPESNKKRWASAWMVADRQQGPVHPLVYPHPETGETTMCFHLGMTDSVVLDEGGPGGPRRASAQEARGLLEELREACSGEATAPWRYAHHWRPGDFIISDNLAVAHEAAPETQMDPAVVGLRLMHRCTIQGDFEPAALRRAAGGALKRPQGAAGAVRTSEAEG